MLDQATAEPAEKESADNLDAAVMSDEDTALEIRMHPDEAVILINRDYDLGHAVVAFSRNDALWLGPTGWTPEPARTLLHCYPQEGGRGMAMCIPSHHADHILPDDVLRLQCGELDIDARFIWAEEDLIQLTRSLRTDKRTASPAPVLEAATADNASDAATPRTQPGENAASDVPSAKSVPGTLGTLGIDISGLPDTGETSPKPERSVEISELGSPPPEKDASAPVRTLDTVADHARYTDDLFTRMSDTLSSIEALLSDMDAPHPVSATRVEAASTATANAAPRDAWPDSDTPDAESVHAETLHAESAPTIEAPEDDALVSELEVTPGMDAPAVPDTPDIDTSQEVEATPPDDAGHDVPRARPSPTFVRGHSDYGVADMSLSSLSLTVASFDTMTDGTEGVEIVEARLPADSPLDVNEAYTAMDVLAEPEQEQEPDSNAVTDGDSPLSLPDDFQVDDLAPFGPVSSVSGPAEDPAAAGQPTFADEPAAAAEPESFVAPAPVPSALSRDAHIPFEPIAGLAIFVVPLRGPVSKLGEATDTYAPRLSDVAALSSDEVGVDVEPEDSVLPSGPDASDVEAAIVAHADSEDPALEDAGLETALEDTLSHDLHESIAHSSSALPEDVPSEPLSPDALSPEVFVISEPDPSPDTSAALVETVGLVTPLTSPASARTLTSTGPVMASAPRSLPRIPNPLPLLGAGVMWTGVQLAQLGRVAIGGVGSGLRAGVASGREGGRRTLDTVRSLPGRVPVPAVSLPKPSLTLSRSGLSRPVLRTPTTLRVMSNRLGQAVSGMNISGLALALAATAVAATATLTIVLRNMNDGTPAPASPSALPPAMDVAIAPPAAREIPASNPAVPEPAVPEPEVLRGGREASIPATPLPAPTRISEAELEDGELSTPLDPTAPLPALQDSPVQIVEIAPVTPSVATPSVETPPPAVDLDPGPAPILPMVPEPDPVTQQPEAEATALTSPETATTAPLPAEEDIARVTEAQVLLSGLDLYRGEANGEAGPATRAALARFRFANNMDGSADFDDAVMARLREAYAGVVAAHEEAERLEAERIETARLEAERLEAERLEAERIRAERLEAERLAAEEAAAAEAAANAVVVVEAEVVRPPKALYPRRVSDDPKFDQRVVVKVGYDIDEDGRVVNARVIENSLEGAYSKTFDRAGISAIERQRFNPRTENGVPTRSTGHVGSVAFE